jgi:Ribbon-helix-helix domain
MSVKFQITLPEPLMAELKQESEKTGVSIAELIRQTMDDRLRSDKRRPKRDPFEALDGLVRSRETDLAGRVDEILY